MTWTFHSVRQNLMNGQSTMLSPNIIRNLNPNSHSLAALTEYDTFDFVSIQFDNTSNAIFSIRL